MDFQKLKTSIRCPRKVSISCMQLPICGCGLNYKKKSCFYFLNLLAGVTKIHIFAQPQSHIHNSRHVKVTNIITMIFYPMFIMNLTNTHQEKLDFSLHLFHNYKLCIIITHLNTTFDFQGKLMIFDDETTIYDNENLNIPPTFTTYLQFLKQTHVDF